MTATKFLDALTAIGTVERVFVYPYVKLVLRSNVFSQVLTAEREITLANQLGLSLDELRKTLHNSLLLLQLLSPSEASPSTLGRSSHWLAGLTESRPAPLTPIISTVHFYGYKGGQARSTVLASFCRETGKNVTGRPKYCTSRLLLLHLYR